MYINPAAYKWFRSRPGLPGPFGEVFSRMMPELCEALTGLQTGHEIDGSLRIYYDRQKSHESVVRVEISKIENESGTCRLFMLTDETQAHITQQRLIQAKENAESAGKAKTDFLATMSHEMRTPLNSIIGFTELMLDEDNSSASAGYLRAIKKSGENLLLLVNDMLDLSKIDAGAIEINATKTNLKELLREIDQNTLPRALEKGLRWEVIIPDDFPAVLMLDGMRVGQVIYNLVSNALKFTNEGTVTLRVGFRKDSDKTGQLEIIVNDTGIGIPKEHHGSIFDVFSQINSQTNRSFGGVGLGLSITRKLIALMNGEIELKSSPGRGSMFRVTLPRIVVAEPYAVSGYEQSGYPGSPNTPELPPALAPADLPASLLPDIQKAKKMFFINDIEKLCSRIEELNFSHKNPYLAGLTNELRMAANGFDIETTEIILLKIEELIQKNSS